MTTAQKRRLIYVCVIAAIPLIALWRGFVVHKLWTWFGVPLGLPVVSVWHAYGLSVLATVLGTLPKRPTIPSGVNSEESKNNVAIEAALTATWDLLVPLITVLAGFTVHYLGGVP